MFENWKFYYLYVAKNPENERGGNKSNNCPADNLDNAMAVAINSRPGQRNKEKVEPAIPSTKQNYQDGNDRRIKRGMDGNFPK